jgi:ketosteroid isomerase-like protein
MGVVVRRVFAALALIAVAVTAAPAQGADSAADARAIRGVREASNRAIAAHDTAAMAATWMPNLHVVTSTSAQMDGRAANLKGFADQFAARPDVVYRRTPESVAVYQTWGMASESGRWAGSWTDVDGKVRIGGSYFAKWQKTDSGWLILAEIYVPSECTGGAYCRQRPAVR